MSALPLVSLPHPALRPYVARYTALDARVPAGATLTVPTVPAGSPALLVRTSGGLAIADGPACGAVGEATFAGQTSRSGRLAFSGAFRGFLVLFTPAGAADLFGLAVGELRDLSVDLGDALGPQARALAGRIADAPTFAAQCAAADAALLARLPGAGPGLGARAAALVLGSAGTVGVAGLAARLGVSERTLRRHVADEVGLAPKPFAQIVRFRAAHAFLAADPRRTWADAVARFGYADQSHLIRAYRRLAGQAPSQRPDAAQMLDHVTGIGP